MALVHGDHAHLHGTKFDFKYLCIQSFGGDIEEFVVTEDAVFQCDQYFLPGHAGIDGYGFYAPLTKILYLVFHQSDEWGDHDAQAFFGESRNLEGD